MRLSETGALTIVSRQAPRSGIFFQRLTMIRPGQTSRFLIAALVAVLVCAAPAVAQTPQLVGGRNVNMTGGSQIISVSPFQVRGDVLGRAQNEPSCAMSTRNPQHILCGANDYRMVDVPGVTTS